MSFSSSQTAFYILGSSGFAREIWAYLIDILKLREKQIFLVDDNSADAITVALYHQRIADGTPSATILGSGRPEIKIKMLKEARGPIFKFVHPRSTVSSFAKIGEGSIIAPGAIVSPRSTVEKHTLINYNSTIGHDVLIKDLAVVSPNASVGGWVVVGEGAYIGSGAQIREKLSVGDWSVVGMGAIVVKKVPPNCVAIGNPAKIYTSDEWKNKVQKNKV